jgi:hypothetical protein
MVSFVPKSKNKKNCTVKGFFYLLSYGRKAFVNLTCSYGKVLTCSSEDANMAENASFSTKLFLINNILPLSVPRSAPLLSVQGGFVNGNVQL